MDKDKAWASSVRDIISVRGNNHVSDFLDDEKLDSIHENEDESTNTLSDSKQIQLIDDEDTEAE